MQEKIKLESPLDGVIATTETTLARLLNSESRYRADAIALYMFYIYTGHWQAKNSARKATRYNPKATDSYARLKLGWGRDRMKNAFGLLVELKLAKRSVKSVGGREGTETYINIQYIPALQVSENRQVEHLQVSGFQQVEYQQVENQHHIQVTEDIYREQKIYTGERAPEKSKELKRSLDYLEKIPEEDLASFRERYEVTRAQVRAKGEALANYCRAHGKTYKDYRAFLQGRLLTDYGYRNNISRTL